MTIASRVFFLEDNGNVSLIPWDRYERLYFGDPAIQFPEYASTEIKGVHVVVLVEDGTVVSIVEMNFFVTYFDADGRIDQRRKLEAQRLLARIRDDRPRTKKPEEAVIDITGRLLEKQYHRLFRWTPGATEAARLEQLIEELLGIRGR